MHFLLEFTHRYARRAFIFKDDVRIESFFGRYDSFSDDDAITDFVISVIKEKAPKIKNQSNVSSVVACAARYIEEHIKDELTIHDVADALKVSSGYLSRSFKKLMHITPKQYLIQCRLRVAKKEFENISNDADVAYDLGFSSQSHMCTVFKKYMGISVKDYKNIIR